MTTTTRSTMRTIDGNQAVSDVAYRLSEVIAIYPITPASPMGEHSDEWSASRRPNLWGSVPEVVEMQSEAGAAGAVHGALSTGALTTTFTASQGLLLMLPNLFKVAGELTPFVVHVAARSIATHALSIFGDHSDVMAARTTGMAMLGSCSPQEAQDMAAIAHAATLRGRVPFLHFFDGFRTSHEIQKVEVLDDDVLRALVDAHGVTAHRASGLSPDRPVVRGTSQNPDTFFQCREAANPFHDRVPEVVEEVMERFDELTGRAYRPVDYVGHPDAERVVVMMGSGAECAHETVEAMVGAGESVGLLKVRLYRPFPVRHLLAALPDSVRAVAVLDRTKEPGAVGEPLLLDVVATLADDVASGGRDALPRVIGGRYGLSSKEFTPAMARAVFAELDAEAPRRRFTVGINDDVTGLSLSVQPRPDDEPAGTTRAVFYGLGADGTVSSNKAAIRIIGERTSLWCQGHFVYDSKKSGATTVSHLRFGPGPIRSTYEIQRADFLAVHAPVFLDRYDVMDRAADGATVLVNAPVAPEELWDRLPRGAQEVLIRRGAQLFVIDAQQIAEQHGLGRRINTIMSMCFFALSGVLAPDVAIAAVKESVEATWGGRGPEIVRRNLAAIDAAVDELHRVPLGMPTGTPRRGPIIPDDAPDLVANVTRLLLDARGEQLPVSAFPPDGTWPTGTSRYERRSIAHDIPIWEPDLCVQCNHCAMVCPHAAIRTRVFDPAAAGDLPDGFAHLPEAHTAELAGLEYVVQVAPDDCTGCGLCVEVCPAKDRSRPQRKALNMAPVEEHRDVERVNWSTYLELPPVERHRIPVRSRTIPLQEPLFEFSGACAGCGETPYIRLLTQLFGDRLVIANATGCSSIYGGNLPTTPYTTDEHGRGPAWSNSLFEDNAEFAMGMRLGLDAQGAHARALLDALAGSLPTALVDELCTVGDRDPDGIAARRDAIAQLRRRLASLQDPRAAQLDAVADEFVPRSVWAIGGDGWAYDIGYGGLDHVLASDRDVNVLVLDTEGYSNTGGQQSKATPIGAVAKFASAGKETAKKDLGLHAMSYGHVYVASIAMQARSHQAVTALLEAEAHPGPSLVIAHSPCISHGYDLVHSPRQQRRAIESGAWPLYRFDPARIAAGEPPLHIDADPVSMSMRDYMREEARFRMVELRDSSRFERLVAAAERGVVERHALYEQIAHIRMPAEERDHG